MQYEIEFEYSFIVTNKAGDSIEGGSRMTMSVRDEEEITAVDAYAIAFESALEEIETLSMPEHTFDQNPDITLTIKALKTTDGDID